jgi:hypothetical protein
VTKPPPQKVETFVAAARDYVRRILGIELDGSETSLAFVDHYIEQTRKGGVIKDEVLELVAPALGAYLGQVAIERFGGRWVADSDNPAEWRVELEPVEFRFYPVGMAAEALRQDEVEGYDASFSTKPGWMAPLGDALAAVPPVEESYYYSLTGRFETIEHAISIVAELERLKREDLN